MKPKVYQVKLGTIPAAIVIRGAATANGKSRFVPGARIQFRRHDGNTGVWTHGIIDRVHPDGFMFVSNN